MTRGQFLKKAKSTKPGLTKEQFIDAVTSDIVRCISLNNTSEMYEFCIAGGGIKPFIDSRLEFINNALNNESVDKPDYSCTDVILDFSGVTSSGQLSRFYPFEVIYFYLQDKNINKLIKDGDLDIKDLISRCTSEAVYPKWYNLSIMEEKDKPKDYTEFKNNKKNIDSVVEKLKDIVSSKKKDHSKDKEVKNEESKSEAVKDVKEESDKSKKKDPSPVLKSNDSNNKTQENKSDVKPQTQKEFKKDKQPKAAEQKKEYSTPVIEEVKEPAAEIKNTKAAEASNLINNEPANVTPSDIAAKFTEGKPVYNNKNKKKQKKQQPANQPNQVVTPQPAAPVQPQQPVVNLNLPPVEQMNSYLGKIARFDKDVLLSADQVTNLYKTFTHPSVNAKLDSAEFRIIRNMVNPYFWMIKDYKELKENPKYDIAFGAECADKDKRIVILMNTKGYGSVDIQIKDLKEIPGPVGI